METSPISLNPPSIIRVLSTVAFLLVLASIAGQLSRFLLGQGHVFGFVNLFNLDAEMNIPTFFSALLLLIAALLLALISLLKGKPKDPDLSKWTILSFGFLFMAFDEAFQVHEGLDFPVRRLLGDGDLGIFYFAWVIPGLALALILSLYFLKFLWRLPRKTMRTFLIAASLYLGGCIGFELIGGRYVELYGFDNLTYTLIATLEESLEMAGVIVFIKALLEYIADNYAEVRFRF
jgi:hypothetical protein